MSEQTQTIESVISEMFTYNKIENPEINEKAKAMASVLHVAAMTVIKSGSRQREGMRAIELMQEAFLYYLSSQASPPVKEESRIIS
jgi:hypothetical protein